MTGRLVMSAGGKLGQDWRFGVVVDATLISAGIATGRQSRGLHGSVAKEIEPEGIDKGRNLNA